MLIDSADSAFSRFDDLDPTVGDSSQGFGLHFLELFSLFDILLYTWIHILTSYISLTIPIYIYMEISKTRKSYSNTRSKSTPRSQSTRRINSTPIRSKSTPRSQSTRSNSTRTNQGILRTIILIYLLI